MTDRHRTAVVALLVGSLLHAGCANTLPVRFLEPEGATIEVRRPGLLSVDQGGTVPFETALAGGAYEVRVSLPAGSGQPTPPLRGVLVVRQVGSGEHSPLPAEFRLMAWDLERVGEGTEVRWSCAGVGWVDLRFKGSLRGYAINDPEVQEWLAESVPQRATSWAPFAWPTSGPGTEPAGEDDAGATFGKVVLGVILVIAYIGYLTVWSVAVLCGGGG